MGGDYSKLTFQPDKHFAAVLLQQGRVSLDSDWNEAEAIREHWQRTLIRDLLGPAAFAGDAFAVTADGERLMIGAGHAWIAGLLCELASDTDVEAQPDLPSFRLPTDSGLYLAYLEVWRREVTATEDPTLQEIALGGPDTTTRLATVAQICLEPVEDDNHARPSDWSIPTKTTDATLAVGGGYQGLENQLYRVEVHDAGPEPTFKWSRDNGSTTATLDAWSATELVLRREQPRFVAGDRLEVIDRVTILERLPGTFVQIERVDGNRLEIATAGPAVPAQLVQPLARRWDGGPILARPGQDPPIELETGLEVALEGTAFRSGDYWVFSARTADGSVTWPDATPAAHRHAPHGVEINRCALASVSRDDNGWSVVRDLRPLFRGHGR
jgi:hypothetical protein